jgi:hypothetical protein
MLARLHSLGEGPGLSRCCSCQTPSAQPIEGGHKKEARPTWSTRPKHLSPGRGRCADWAFHRRPGSATTCYRRTNWTWVRLNRRKADVTRRCQRSAVLHSKKPGLSSSSVSWSSMSRFAYPSRANWQPTTAGSAPCGFYWGPLPIAGNRFGPDMGLASWAHGR